MRFRDCFLWLLCASLGLAQDGQLTRQEAAARSARISEVRYDLQFEFASGSDTYDGYAIVSFSDAQPSQPLFLDFEVDKLNAVVMNDQTFPDIAEAFQSGRFHIPPEKLVQGRNTIAFTYQARFTTTGSGFHRYVDPADDAEYHYTDFQPFRAHHVFPCFDQPDLRAPIRLTVSMPKHWTIMSNGPPISNRYAKGKRKIEFRPTPVISTYLFNLTLGDFAMWQDSSGPVPMRLFCRQSQADYLDSEGIFEVTRKGLNFFADYFDYPYPFEKYDQAFVPEYNAGAMENAGAVVLNEALNLGFQVPPSLLAYRDAVIMHEIAHHWFGNLVSLKWWDDLWLNESFASYMELVSLPSLGHDENWTQTAEPKNRAYEQEGLSTSHPIVVPVPDVQVAASIFDEITYTKGMAVLQQLDFALGGTVFRDAIRDYLRTHAWRSTTIHDFTHSLAKNTSRDLKAWTQNWLFDRGVNRARLEWHTRDGKISSATMHQAPGNGSGQLRHHAALLGLFEAGGETGASLMREVRVDYSSATTEIPELVGLPAPDFILPNWQECDYVVSELDAKSLAWFLEHLPEVTSPAVRTQAWQILWQMVSEKKLGAADFIQLAYLDMLVQEEGETLRLIMDYVLTVLDTYWPDDPAFIPLRTKLFDFAKSNLEEENNDYQYRFLLFILMYENAVTNEQLAFIQQLAGDDTELAGWTLDDQDRLSLVETLMVRQYKGAQTRFESFAKTAIKPDPDVLSLLASCPLKETKAKAWQWIFENSTLSLENKRTLMADFFAQGQHSLTKSYIPKYFNELERVYQTGEWAFARDMVEMMFPRTGEKVTLKAARRFLKRRNPPPVLRNLVISQMETLEARMSVRAFNKKLGTATGQ